MAGRQERWADRSVIVMVIVMVVIVSGLLSHLRLLLRSCVGGEKVKSMLGFCQGRHIKERTPGCGLRDNIGRSSPGN